MARLELDGLEALINAVKAGQRRPQIENKSLKRSRSCNARGHPK